MAEQDGSEKGKRQDFDMEKLLQKLNLSEAEKEGVFLAKEERANLPEVKWMVVGKLLTIKDFSNTALFSTMRAAWNSAREVTFRPMGKNLFIIQAFCLGDWKRIMEEGPWTFRGYALMLEEFDGSTITSQTTPNRVPAWIHIHKIPHLYRTDGILKQLASKVWECVLAELKVVSTTRGDFHRARVMLLATKPLVRFVALAPEGCQSMFLQIKYEKIHRFCSHCGFVGHTHLECGTGESKEEELQFGAWMLADEDTWRPSTPRVQGYVQPEDSAPRGDRTSEQGRAPGHFAQGGRAGRGGMAGRPCGERRKCRRVSLQVCGRGTLKKQAWTIRRRPTQHRAPSR